MKGLKNARQEMQPEGNERRRTEGGVDRAPKQRGMKQRKKHNQKSNNPGARKKEAAENQRSPQELKEID